MCKFFLFPFQNGSSVELKNIYTILIGLKWNSIRFPSFEKKSFPYIFRFKNETILLRNYHFILDHDCRRHSSGLLLDNVYRKHLICPMNCDTLSCLPLFQAVVVVSEYMKEYVCVIVWGCRNRSELQSTFKEA